MPNLVINQNDYTNECIRVPKLYDWVVAGIDDVTTVPIPPASLAIINDALAQGHTLEVTATIPYIPPADPIRPDVDASILSIVRRVICIDGREVEIGCLHLSLVANAVISVIDLDLQPPAVITVFNAAIPLFERVGVCFPEEFNTNNISVSIISASTTTLTNVPVNDSFLFEIDICFDVQVETEVILSVEGKFCEPRENTVNCTARGTCAVPSFPPQCPELFPCN